MLYAKQTAKNIHIMSLDFTCTINWNDLLLDLCSSVTKWQIWAVKTFGLPGKTWNLEYNDRTTEMQFKFSTEDRQLAFVLMTGQLFN